MLPPADFRAFDGADCSILVNTLPDGKFLVVLQSGAVAIRISVPAEQIPVLFPSPTQGGAA